ncbi:putative major facilitator superfamily transporter [Streptomyces sp. NBRC 110611]|uniref:MFS transporter n=1 Tax=Streptomyces sp. NBRC 110611 TaxID=1621259 RepID=UPI00083392FF|nr:MFS transporter [Streptomyces sp. NBRC 110611]GAU65777.1 putative major facilitator superfamily transporter [Streptomyces sp. NBRC 110611]
MTAEVGAGAGGAEATCGTAGRHTDEAGEGAVRTVARRLLPLLFVLYVVNFLDRANIGVAALAMNTELHLSATAYGTAAGIFFLGYVLFHIPAAVALGRFGARRWLSGVVIAWGLCSATTAFVTEAHSLYAARFLLGLAEAGFFPGVVAYLAAWFPSRQRTRALAVFLLAIPLSTAIGLPASGLLVEHSGFLGLSGWRSMFLIEAAPAVVLGIAALRLLPDTPRQATWLTAAQRDALEAQLAQDAPPPSAGRAAPGRAALGRATPFAVVHAGACFALYSLHFFLPQALGVLFPGAGTSGVSALAALPSVAAALAMLGWSRYSDRAGPRTGASLIAVPLAIATLAAVLAALSDLPVLTLAALVVTVAGSVAAGPAFWSRCTGVLAGRHAATGIAGVNAVGSLASFAGPSLTGHLTDATGGYRAVYVVLAGALAVSSAVALRLPAVPAASPAPHPPAPVPRRRPG